MTDTPVRPDVEHYAVVEVAPTPCECGDVNPRYRVTDTRKKHGERYPRPLKCYLCAKKQQQKLNGEALRR